MIRNILLRWRKKFPNIFSSSFVVIKSLLQATLKDHFLAMHVWRMMFNFGPEVGINFNCFDQFFTCKLLLSRLYIQILIIYRFTRQENNISWIFITQNFCTSRSIPTKSLLVQVTMFHFYLALKMIQQKPKSLSKGNYRSETNVHVYYTSTSHLMNSETGNTCCNEFWGWK